MNQASHSDNNSGRVRNKRFHWKLVVYPKDISIITGRGLRAAQKLHREIREFYGKAEHQLITTNEFCYFMGLDEELVQHFIND